MEKVSGLWRREHRPPVSRHFVSLPSLAFVMNVLGCDSNLDASAFFESHLIAMLVG